MIFIRVENVVFIANSNGSELVDKGESGEMLISVFLFQEKREFSTIALTRRIFFPIL